MHQQPQHNAPAAARALWLLLLLLLPPPHCGSCRPAGHGGVTAFVARLLWCLQDCHAPDL
jgi:hypothetical protein